MSPKRILTQGMLDKQIRLQRNEKVPQKLKLKAYVKDRSYEVENISETGVRINIQGQKFEASDFFDLEVKGPNNEYIYKGEAKLSWSDANSAGLEYHSYQLKENFIPALDEASDIKDLLVGQEVLFKNLDPDYVYFISAAKSYLRVLKERLEELDKRAEIQSEETRQSLLEAIDKSIATDILQQLDGFSKKLNQYSEAYASDPAKKKAAIQYFRQELQEYFIENTFIRRAYEKPKGYAGDYEMMNQIYRNSYEGRSSFSKLIHKYGVNETSSVSVRERREYFCNQILELSKGREEFTVGSLACGPAKELVDFVSRVDSSSQTKFTFVLMDQDWDALTNARRNITPIIKERGLDVNLVYAAISVKDILENTNDAEKLQPQSFDFIYSAGLYDYLTQPVAKFLTASLWQLLKDQGKLILGNFHPSNPTKTISEFAADWKLIHRTEKEMYDLVDGLDFKKADIVLDSKKIEQLLEVIK